jgi:hypothetical protein
MLIIGKNQRKTMISGHATFATLKWDESAYLELEDGSKCTRSTNVYSYDGDITGDSNLEYLMFYRPDKTGSAVGIEYINGTLGGKRGSFVLQHEGTFDLTGVQLTWKVVPGSGTGELVGLRGTGTIVLDGHAERYPTDFEYSFE